eukprot:CAMPEP_0113696120 /NCGR_PEP_ID=MMETSP0038_2-20120614/21298_1 /TAXON_ID=2898 /ORGANISM="Cryptomonas paramecium" /LENGTH=46 /DNA_ID=CAMNT_0000618777 /DNA_START=106 /DNA_END=242 /DNA_ORIENTATION=+ /assembly_acc=CAM_ASM_000170
MVYEDIVVISHWVPWSSLSGSAASPRSQAAAPSACQGAPPDSVGAP